MRNRVLTLGLVTVAGWASLLDAAEFKRVATEKPITKISAFKIGTLTVGKDGRRFAFARQAEGGWSVEVDGKVEATHKDVGPINPNLAKTALGAMMGLKPMIFSGNGQHLAYGARQPEGWAMVLDGKPGKAFKSIGGPVLSPDGQRLAYAAQLPRGWCVVADGVEGKTYEKVGPPVLSSDGKRLAYATRAAGKEMIVVDGVEGKAYESVDTVPGLLAAIAFPNMVAAFPTFSPDGRLAYLAKQAGKWHVVVEGQESETFESVGDVYFSPDAKRVAFPAKKGLTWSWIVDGQAVGSFQDEITKKPVFSPDSKHFVFVAKSGGKESVFLDGRSVGTHDEVGLPVFSPDGSRLAYPAKSGKQWAMSLDGALQAPYTFVLGPVFSPDGSHLAYEAAQAEQRWVVVVDGVEGKPSQGLVQGASVVFDDNTHLHYLAVRASQVLLVEEELVAEAAPPNP